MTYLDFSILFGVLKYVLFKSIVYFYCVIILHFCFTDCLIVTSLKLNEE